MLADRYALEEELGRSATGMVWRAEDRLLGRTVAVKVIHPALGDDPAFSDRLALEARRVASLAAPGVARLLDSGEEEGIPFLVREHVEGESVRSVLDRSGPRSPAEAMRIAIGVLDALAPAHEAGVLHLHLEPDDVLLTPDGSVRVTDLGIGPAVTETRRPSEAARLLGGGSLAPEQSHGAGPVDERADVFAVGALLFELLTGEPHAGRRSAREVRGDVPRPVDRAVGTALAPEPDERFDDLRSFAAALRASRAEMETRAVQRRGWMRTWLGVPVAVAILAAAAIGVGLWLGDLEVGGPLGIRPAQDPIGRRPPQPPATQELRPVAVEVIDPFGDRSENDSTAPLAIDGDPNTAWRSEGYRYPDGGMNKPGIGLVFDLAVARGVTGFRLVALHPGFTFHLAVGEDPEVLVQELGEAFTAEAETEGAVSGSGRYVLVWITSVVPTEDDNRAEVAEFSVSVTDDG